MPASGFFRLCLSGAALALVVVLLGAWVRLEDAGLGCPDWPGCYGQLLGVPEDQTAVEAANRAYPERPVETGKAWKEMIHRYVAGVLGLLVFALAAVAVRRRRQPNQPLVLPLFLAAFIICQAVLGMWTVTMQLKPLVVTFHLLGGMATLGMLWWLTLRTGPLVPPVSTSNGVRTAVALVAGVVVAQITLGGWVSTNYAALACTDFPRCQGAWWPEADFREGFTLWHGLGQDYEFGVLEHPARVAIQLVHRIGAVVTAVAVIAVAVLTWLRVPVARVRGVVAVLLTVLTAQWLLGVTNVLASLPLPVAVAHNGGAALLLLTFITLYHSLTPRMGRDHGSEGSRA